MRAHIFLAASMALALPACALAVPLVRQPALQHSASHEVDPFCACVEGEGACVKGRASTTEHVKAQCSWRRADSSRGSLRWTVSSDAPRLLLPPKTGTITMIKFVNGCTGGRISPAQRLCADSTCPLNGAMTQLVAPVGHGDFAHLHCGEMEGNGWKSRAQWPSEGERTYLVLRQPVGK